MLGCLTSRHSGVVLLVIILIVDFTDKVQSQQFLYGLLSIESNAYLQNEGMLKGLQSSVAALNNELADTRSGWTSTHLSLSSRQSTPA